MVCQTILVLLPCDVGISTDGLLKVKLTTFIIVQSPTDEHGLSKYIFILNIFGRNNTSHWLRWEEWKEGLGAALLVLDCFIFLINWGLWSNIRACICHLFLFLNWMSWNGDSFHYIGCTCSQCWSDIRWFSLIPVAFARISYIKYVLHLMN